MTQRRAESGFESVDVAATTRSREELTHFDERIADLERQIAESGSMPDEGLQRVLENAKLEREIFLSEHDSTGAWKRDRFGRDLADMLQRQGSERKGSMFVVNMGELDRVNDESHQLGDIALTELRMRISREVERALPDTDASSINIYRIASNDFAVTLEGIDAPDVVRAIKESLTGSLMDINAQRAERGEGAVSEAAGVEGLPLAVTEALSFDHVQRIYENLPQKAQTGDTAWISCLQEASQVLSDFEKTRSRTERLAQKIREKGVDDPQTEILYTKYLQKSVGSVFPRSGEEAAVNLTFQQFVEQMSARGAFEASRSAWDSALFTASIEDAMRQFSNRSAENRALFRAVAQQAAEGFELQAQQRQIRIASDLQSAIEAPVSSSTRRAEALSEVVPEDLEAFDGLLADESKGFGPTEGEQRIAEIQSQLDAAQSSLEAFPADGDQRERYLLSLTVQNLLLQQRRFSAQYDRSTGLGLRGKYFETLKTQLREQKPVSILAIDMAFLKYFDRDGGTKTGDRAIRAAGRILGAVSRDIRAKYGDVSIETFRKGGDEFNILAGTTDPKILQDIQDLIRQKTFDLGPVPADEGGSGGYLPTELQFNVGVTSAEASQDERDPDDIDHRADLAIGPDKAVQRYVFLLLKRLRAERLTDPTERAKQQTYLSNLTARSEKALIGGSEPITAYVEELLRSGKDATSAAEDVAKKIIDLVRSRLGEDAAKQEALQEGTEEVIAHQLEVMLLHQHVEELARRLTHADEVNEELQQTVSSLRQAVKAALEDRNEVAQLRERIKAVSG